MIGNTGLNYTSMRNFDNKMLLNFISQRWTTIIAYYLSMPLAFLYRELLSANQIKRNEETLIRD